MKPAVRILALLACLPLVLSACGGSGGDSGKRYKRDYTKASRLYKAAKKLIKRGDLDAASDKLDDAARACERLIERITRRSHPYRKSTQELMDQVQKSINDVAEKVKAQELAAKQRQEKIARAQPVSTPSGVPVQMTMEMQREKQRFERQQAERLKAQQEESANLDDENVRSKTSAARRKAAVEEASDEDFDDEQEKRAGRTKEASKMPEEKGGFDPRNITPETPAVVIGKRKFQGKFFIVHLWFVNKGEVCRIGRVVAQLRDANHKLKTESLAFYRGEGFEPNWKDIYESKGEALAADSIQVQQNQAAEIVCVGEFDRRKEVKKIEIEVIIGGREPIRSQVEDF